ncbi:OadG family protein [Marinitoga aeolica]|uniref:OadG family protein n=1 Tax=Marinitoga aeolica TaxID=2809031 RepID=A0ABY8PS56_9BACT|nr:OadG family protein [Marinitoga aeolica]WGS65455.1 OadG family protein [Marinitoga aeolica]
MGNVLSITFVGIVIVFLVLFILSMFFVFFRFLSPTNEKKVKKEINIPHQNPKPVNNIELSKEIEDDSELVAAIMGAITMAMGNKSYKIKSIKPATIMKNKKYSMWGMLPPVVTWRAKRLGGRK